MDTAKNREANIAKDYINRMLVAKSIEELQAIYKRAEMHLQTLYAVCMVGTTVSRGGKE